MKSLDDKTVWIFEAGINSVPSSWRDWTNRAIEYVNLSTDGKAVSLQYFTTALTVFIRERERSKSLARLIRGYSCRDWEINIAAHSNGTRVALEGWRLAGYPKIKSLHLLCGACSSNFERLGLNYTIRTHKVGDVFVYRAMKDWAMRLEDTILGHWLFGIRVNDKPLGLVGPQNVSVAAAGHVHTINWAGYGHSDCWKHFDATIKLVVGR